VTPNSAENIWIRDPIATSTRKYVEPAPIKIPCHLTFFRQCSMTMKHLLDHCEKIWLPGDLYDCGQKHRAYEPG
jgi:hypothetical protein